MSVDMNVIETQIKLSLNRARIGVKTVNLGDLQGPAINYPSVRLIRLSRTQNDLQVFGPSKIGWDIVYDMHCLLSGAENQTTIKNSNDFVEAVYEVMQEEQTTQDLLNGEVFDLDCINIDYGLLPLNMSDKAMVYGGVIRMIIQIFESR